MRTPVVTPVAPPFSSPSCHPYVAAADRELRCGDCGNRMFSSRAEALLDQGLRCSRCLGTLELIAPLSQ